MSLGNIYKYYIGVIVLLHKLSHRYLTLWFIHNRVNKSVPNIWLVKAIDCIVKFKNYNLYTNWLLFLLSYTVNIL